MKLDSDAQGLQTFTPVDAYVFLGLHLSHRLVRGKLINQCWQTAFEP